MKIKLAFRFEGSGGELIGGESRRNSLRLQESQPKSLAIEVMSSQSKVSVSVDGTTVSRIKGIEITNDCNVKRLFLCITI